MNNLYKWYENFFLQKNLKEMLNNLWSCRCSFNLSSDKEVINNSRNFYF